MEGPAASAKPANYAQPTQQDESVRWYAVFTHPNSEELAAQHLARQGFKTYLPFRLKTIRHARRFITKRSAYFSGYLFVSLDLQRQRWRAINSTIGVNSLVMCESGPLPVVAGIVEALISATEPSGLLRPSKFTPGQRVRVTAGAFEGQLGLLDKVDGDGAVKILLEIMYRHVPVRLGRDQVVILA
jgi:transcriptional antiterminator RfaH